MFAMTRESLDLTIFFPWTRSPSDHNGAKHPTVFSIWFFFLKGIPDSLAASSVLSPHLRSRFLSTVRPAPKAPWCCTATACCCPVASTSSTALSTSAAPPPAPGSPPPLWRPPRRTTRMSRWRTKTSMKPTWSRRPTGEGVHLLVADSLG